MSRAVVVFPFLPFLIACGAASGSPAYDHSTPSEADLATLAQLKAGREAWQLAAKQAEERANFQDCRLKVNELEFAVRARLLKCQDEHARESECQAAKAKKSGEGMAIGCVLGMLFPEIGLIGCIGGAAVGENSADKCVPAACQSDPNIVRREILAEHHLNAVPQCVEPAGSVQMLIPAPH